MGLHAANVILALQTCFDDQLNFKTQELQTIMTHVLRYAYKPYTLTLRLRNHRHDDVEVYREPVNMVQEIEEDIADED